MPEPVPKTAASAVQPLPPGLLLPSDPAFEPFRRLRDALLLGPEGATLHTIAVAGVHPGAGASTVAAHLALAIAQAGSTTVLVDGDLARPALHSLFAVAPGDGGLANLLRRDAGGPVLVRPEGVPADLLLLPAGSPPADPDLLSLSSITPILAELRTTAAYMVLDAGPVLTSTAASVLGAAADGTVLVVRSGSTARAAAQQAAGLLARVQAHLLGVVLTGAGLG